MKLVSVTIVVGAAAGAVIGGLGGRLAMRILFLTSDDRVKGVVSDDGFEIGRFTLGATLGLIAVTTVLGIFSGLAYLWARPFLLEAGIPAVPASALLYGTVGGAMLVHTDGVDFTLLEPAALAIAMFVALMAAFGAVVAFLVNRAAADQMQLANRSWWLLGPPLVVLAFPPLLLFAAVALLVTWGASIAGPTGRVWPLVRTAALVVMAALTIFGAVDLAGDVSTLT